MFLSSKILSRRIKFSTPIILFSVPTFYMLYDPGRRRTAKFWITVFPAFIHYKTVEGYYNSNLIQKRKHTSRCNRR